MKLLEIADEAEKRGGCDDGVLWGREHELTDVGKEMRPDYASWVLLNMLDFLDAEAVTAFVDAVERDAACASRVWFHVKLSAEDAQRLHAKAASELKTFDEKSSRGEWTRKV